MTVVSGIEVHRPTHMWVLDHGNANLTIGGSKQNPVGPLVEYTVRCVVVVVRMQDRHAPVGDPVLQEE